MVLTRILPSRYSPGSHLSDTRPDPTFSVLAWILPFFGTHPNFTFLVLARIPHYRYSSGFPFSDTHQDFTFPVLTQILPFPVLAWISIFWHSPGFYHFPVLTRTLLRYSPGSHITGTRTESPFPVLTRILPSRYSLGFYLFWYSPGFLFSGTRPDSTIFGTRPDSTISRYSPGPFFGTRPDFTFFGTILDFYFQTLARILPFPGTHPDPSSVLPRILHFQHLPGFYLFRYLPRSKLFRCLPGPFSGVCSDFLIFSGIAPEFHYLFRHCARITHLPRHRAWFSLSPSIGVTLFR